MGQSGMIGNRIRDRRVIMGLKQSELAREVGISPSYLNLIEHNRRRIGGKVLLLLADKLQVEPTLLSEGSEAALLDGLRVAAHALQGQSAELDRTEEFAGRFPGWAQLVLALHQKAETLEQTVKTLTDRLANDPHLAASLHDVISTVTAIRSTASILVETKELEPEWSARFHRNLNEDSRRLAEGAEALVHYLEGAPDTDDEIRSPLDEMHAFLAEHAYRFDSVERHLGDSDIPRLVAEARSLSTDHARQLSDTWLRRAYEDARRLPMQSLNKAIDLLGLHPDLLARQLQVDLPLLFRRMASLDPQAYGPVGLVICDGSGTLTFRKPIPGFAVPNAAGACTLWPLYRALHSPLHSVDAVLEQAGGQREPIQSYSVAEVKQPPKLGEAGLMQAYMLLLPGRVDEGNSPIEVGASCRICSRTTCPARREPSLLSE